MVFENVNFYDSWWQKLGITYITENVYGTVVDSKPNPGFITEDGDQFVNRDNFDKMFSLVWEEITGLFSKDSNKMPYGNSFKVLVSTFQDLRKKFLQ